MNKNITIPFNFLIEEVSFKHIFSIWLLQQFAIKAKVANVKN